MFGYRSFWSFRFVSSHHWQFCFFFFLVVLPCQQSDARWWLLPKSAVHLYWKIGSFKKAHLLCSACRRGPSMRGNFLTKGLNYNKKNGLLHTIDNLTVSHFVTLSNSTSSFNNSLIIMKSLFTNMIKELLAYSVYVQQQVQLDNLCFKKANKNNVWNYSEFRSSYSKHSFLSCFWPLHYFVPHPA